MLSIGKVTPGRADYYEKSVARGRDDYYSGSGEAPGAWLGAGARMLGLHGRVEAERFNAMVAGIDPSDPDLRRALLSKERKSRTINGKRHDPVAAYDLTFSAPKSVSVLFALGDAATARELVAAHDAAVQAAFEYLEDSAVYTRRGRNGSVVEQGEGLIAAAYRHRMARSKDPQLHTHVVAANLVRTPSDGQWRALHAAVIYRHARTAGVLYQAHLRAEVRDRLGLTWGPVSKAAAELEAVPSPVLREFSRRRIAIEQAARDGRIGLGTKAAAEALALKTRPSTDRTVRTVDWRLHLRARAEELGFDHQTIASLLADGHDRLLEPRTEPIAAVPDAELRTTGDDAEPLPVDRLADRLVGPHGLTALRNTFGEQDVLTAVAEHHQQGVRVAGARRDAATLLRRPEVLDARPIESGGLAEDRFTTADLVASEQRLIAAAVERKHAGVGLIGRSTLDQALARTSRPLTQEQEQVVRAVAGSGNGVEVIEALAGSGKTFTAGVLRDVYAQTDVPVIGVAPTGRAARELSEVGIPARTLHATLASLEHHPELGLPRGSVVILDEAGMAPTRLTEQLLDAAREAGAKVVAIGDSGQLPSVEAGGWMRQVGAQVGANRLTSVQRQRDPEERRMLGLLHDGIDGGRCYLEWLDRHGRLTIDADAAVLIEEAVQGWGAAVVEHGIDQAALIARDHQTRHALNTQARAWHAERGGLGEERAYGPMVLACGDRVIARRNDREVDVDNGTRGTVTYVHANSVEIRTDGGSLRTLPAAYVEDHIEYAYALTGHGMQGATVEWAAVVARPEHLTQGWSYTALSRARQETRLYVSSVDPIKREERADIAPHDSVEVPNRAETIAFAARRMRERDDEDLAVSQLIERQPRAGGPGDTDLDPTNPTRIPSPAVPQEEAAQRAQPTVPPRDYDELVRITALIRELEQQRDPGLIRRLQRLDDLAVERVRVVDQRARARQLFAALPAPRVRKFRGRTDEHAGQRAALAAAMIASDERLATNDRDQEALRSALGVDPVQAHAEHRDRETRIGQLDRHRIEVLDRVVERVIDERPPWLVERVGTRPDANVAAERWDEAARALARQRVDRDTADVVETESRPPIAKGSREARPRLEPPDPYLPDV